jgi:hypothetical protein
MGIRSTDCRGADDFDERPMVDLAGAELRDFVHEPNFARDTQVGQTLGLDGLSHFIHRQAWDIANGDEFLAFLFVVDGHHGDLAAQAVLGEGTC